LPLYAASHCFRHISLCQLSFAIIDIFDFHYIDKTNRLPRQPHAQRLPRRFSQARDITPRIFDVARDMIRYFYAITRETAIKRHAPRRRRSRDAGGGAVAAL